MNIHFLAALALFAVVGLSCATTQTTAQAPCSSCATPCAHCAKKGGKGDMKLLPEGYASLGTMKVWPLSDGQLQLKPALFQGLPSEEKLKILGAETEESTLATPVNVFLVESAEQRILIDAGAGSVWGPASGQLTSALAAKNMALESIHAVLVTHLHGDHVGGLLTDDMKAPRFPNATVWVHAAELAFWTQNPEQIPEAQREFFKQTHEGTQLLVATLGDKLKTFSAEKQELFPGVKAVHAPGHTPGHTLFMLHSEGKKLLATGDLIPNMQLHTAHPHVHFFFDVEPEAAAATRLKWMKKAAQKGLWVASPHAPFPGIGRLEKQADNTFNFLPVE